MTALAAQAEQAHQQAAAVHEALAAAQDAMTGPATAQTMRQALQALGDAAEALHECRVAGYVQPHDLAELVEQVGKAQMQAADWVEA